nr:restriction endonuclease subunit S [Candidatus Mycoplasma haemohominis]
MTYSEINEEYSECIDEVISFTDEKELTEKNYCEKGDLLITRSSHTLDKIGTASVYLQDKPCLIGENVLCFRHNQNPKYISYALSLNTSKQQKKRYASKGVAVYIKSKDIKKIKIPLPSLEIQEQVVEVLDAFRELVRELENEIKLRKQQFEYYKEKLISNIDKSEFKKFG